MKAESGVPPQIKCKEHHTSLQVQTLAHTRSFVKIGPDFELAGA